MEFDAISRGASPFGSRDTPDSNELGVSLVCFQQALAVLRFAAALFKCFVRHFADELAVLHGAAARFHFFAGLSAHHLLCRSCKTDWRNQKSSGDKRQHCMFHLRHLLRVYIYNRRCPKSHQKKSAMAISKTAACGSRIDS